MLSSCSSFKESNNQISTSASASIKIDISNQNYDYEDFEFIEFENELIISKYIGNKEKLIIPKYYDDKKIVGIESDAFPLDNNIKELVINDNMYYFPKNSLSNLNIKLNYEDGFIYLPSENNSKYLLVGIYEHKEEATIDNAVKVIASCALTNLNIRKIQINENVTYINSDAISNLHSLEEVIDFSSSYNNKFISDCPYIEYMFFKDKKYKEDFYDSEKIEYAFKNDIDIKKRNMIDGIEDITRYNDCYYYLKNNKASILKIPNNIYSLHIYNKIPFDNKIATLDTINSYDISSDDILKLSFDDDIKYINKSSIHDSNNLKEIYLPKNIEYLDKRAIINCDSLKSIVISKNSRIDNLYFISNDNVTIYFEDKKPNYDIGNIKTYRENVKQIIEHNGVIYYLNGNDELVISDAKDDIEQINIRNYLNIDNNYYPIVKIKDNAFKNCFKLNSIKINSNIHTIERKAFFNCLNLKYIYIPNTIETIESDVFTSNDMLIEMEARIKKDTYSNNFSNGNKVVYNIKR